MYQQQEEQEELEQPLPDYGQIDGQKIRLGGLDYSLLQKENITSKKDDLMKQIKSKLKDFSFMMPVEKNSNMNKLTQQNDQLTKNILGLNHLKPTINQSTYYLFPTQLEFTPHEPQIITRRFGRMHIFPLYVYHKPKEIDEFNKLIQSDRKLKVLRRQQEQQAKKIVPEFAFGDQSDQDDIFSQKSSNQDINNQTNIKIGNKLSFGIDEKQIFGGARYKQVVKQAEQAPKVVDKYDFLQKKRKPNEDDVGYDQCYINTGFSLQQMKQFRKQGIQIFGDAKEYVQKQRKYDINKDYQKIKRIIEQKSKKT